MSKKTKEKPLKAASNKAKKPLKKQAILKKALGLADKEGIENLSMRKLAKSLNVEAMSLYHHFKNKEEILDGIVDIVFKEINWPADSSDWKLAMRERGIAARVVLKKHSWAVSLLESRTNPGPETLDHHNSVIGCFRNAGFTIAQAAHAYSLLDSYTYGFVMQEQNLPFENPEQIKAIGEAIMSNFPVGQYPYLLEMMHDHVFKPGYSYAGEFLVGLDIILDGIERSR